MSLSLSVLRGQTAFPGLLGSALSPVPRLQPEVTAEKPPHFRCPSRRRWGVWTTPGRKTGHQLLHQVPLGPRARTLGWQGFSPGAKAMGSWAHIRLHRSQREGPGPCGLLATGQGSLPHIVPSWTTSRAVIAREARHPKALLQGNPCLQVGFSVNCPSKCHLAGPSSRTAVLFHPCQESHKPL